MWLYMKEKAKAQIGLTKGNMMWVVFLSQMVNPSVPLSS